LVVFSEPLGMVFLPGGGVLPPDMQPQWAELTAQLHASPRPNKTEVTQLTATLMRKQLAPHGFVPRRIEDDWDVQFVRPTRDGYQSVLMRVIGDSPFLRCVVRCTHRSDEVETIFEQVFGPATRITETFWFNPSIFVGASGGDLPIENSDWPDADRRSAVCRHVVVAAPARQLPVHADRALAWRRRGILAAWSEPRRPVPRTDQHHVLQLGHLFEWKSHRPPRPMLPAKTRRNSAFLPIGDRRATPASGVLRDC
jgi:hypothetical protein